jgi:hypothetical protein
MNGRKENSFMNRAQKRFPPIMVEVEMRNILRHPTRGKNRLYRATTKKFKGTTASQAQGNISLV